MRGSARCEPRRDVPVDVVRGLLEAAQQDLADARLLTSGRLRDRTLHTAEQVGLLLRLAADTGARPR